MRLSAFARDMRGRVLSRWFAALFLLYAFGIFSILRANRLYLDDLGRALYGYADWSAAVRPLTDFLAWLFYLGPVTVDASPLTQLMAAAILALTSLLLITAVRAKPSWGALLCTVPVGLSPYGLENLSYRFDAPWMALALALAVLPFCLRGGLLTRLPWRFLLAASLCLFASACLYQPALGAYLAVSAYAILIDLSSRRPLALVLRRALRFIAPFCLGIGVYSLQASFWLADSSQQDYAAYVSQHYALPPLADMPGVVASNIAQYISLLAGDWSGNGIGFALALVTALFTLLLLARCVRAIRCGGSLPGGAGRLVLLLLILACFLLTPFGIQYVLPAPVWAPRTFHAFGVMAALMLLFLRAAMAGRVRARRALCLLRTIFVVQLFIFAQVYGNLLDAQGQWELSHMSLLASDLNRFIRETGSSRVDFAGSVGLSPLVRTPARKYPLLQRLVAVPLTRDWRWGYEQLNTYGVSLIREDVAENIAPEHLRPFLETPAYRIDQTPEGVGLVRFLPQPGPRPLEGRNFRHRK